ncbi:hypothetical protein BY458DRAFT_472696 [Sporodiniella umbellata]|nr:hypothetical protein BY458DRAFT_472696 [Sporodiniella umbellata]
MLRQLTTLSKLTTSSIKHAANNTAAFVGLTSKDDTLPSPQMIAYWINETQKGLDAFFNDKFELAQAIFIQHNQESPFHAVGFALMAYVEAMLEFEVGKIQIALERITAAEVLAKQFVRKVRKKSWQKLKNEENDCDLVSFDSSGYTPKRTRSPEIQYELLATNCMLMSATVQFLKNSWLEYMKAAYKLRKAYKLYEFMFETITGKKASDYDYCLRQKNKSSLLNHDEKSIVLDIKLTPHPSGDSRDLTAIESSLESGVFFGIGLLSLVFSLLPPKVNKILNTLGFQSSRPFALHLLQRSFRNSGLYSSLSALSLLVYYTNLSLFIHPQLLPSSFCIESARQVLDQMKDMFPNGKIWKLLEGKLCKMEGKTRRGVEILRDARRRESVNVDVCSKRISPPPMRKTTYNLSQLHAFAVYEMGWGQIFLGDYFQASETFFRLEDMNNWSRAFYHYIASCCIFADEEYDKASAEFAEIVIILKRKKQHNAKLLPDEIFAERKIRHWKTKAAKGQVDINLDEVVLDGACLKKVVIVHPLWELVYLWNGFSQLTPSMLQQMKYTIETSLETLSKEDIGTDLCHLYLLLGVGVRELGDYELAFKYLEKATQSETAKNEDKWVLPHVFYEMAVLDCFLFQSSKRGKDPKLLKEAADWIHKCEKQLLVRHSSNTHTNDSNPYDSSGDSDWEGRLHIRCQLLIEKLDDF